MSIEDAYNTGHLILSHFGTFKFFYVRKSLFEMRHTFRNLNSERPGFSILLSKHITSETNSFNIFIKNLIMQLLGSLLL